MTVYEKIKNRRLELGMSQQKLADKLGYKSKSAINKIESGLRDIRQSKVIDFANALLTTPSYLMGWDDEELNVSNLTSGTTAFPIINENNIDCKRKSTKKCIDKTIEIPNIYLDGKNKDNYFVLQINGNSMYPHFQDGDKILISKQNKLGRSGEIGVITYKEEFTMLKKIEFSENNDWIKIIPLNPQYIPKTLTDETAKGCKIIGVPKLIIRNFEQI